MKPDISNNSPIVLVANGLFPIHPIPLSYLDRAEVIFAIDGGVHQAIKHQYQPDKVFGDLDSSSIEDTNFQGDIIELPDQNKTDLEKTLDWCINHHFLNVILLGASGLREDMTLANHYILFDYFERLSIEMITDHFTITCHKGLQSFQTSPRETVSIIAQRSGTVVSSTALKYPLNNFILDPSARAISNQSIGTSFSVDASDPVLVFRSHPKNE